MIELCNEVELDTQDKYIYVSVDVVVVAYLLSFLALMYPAAGPRPSQVTVCKPAVLQELIGRIGILTKKPEQSINL